jgi:hypothetical protein
MNVFTIFKPSLLLAACPLPIRVHTTACITAGQMDNSVWAPQFQTVRLLDEAGRISPVKNKFELTQVRAVELNEAVLLSVCDTNKALSRADCVQSKGPVPAAKPGLFRRLFTVSQGKIRIKRSSLQSAVFGCAV